MNISSSFFSSMSDISNQMNDLRANRGLLKAYYKKMYDSEDEGSTTAAPVKTITNNGVVRDTLPKNSTALSTAAAKLSSTKENKLFEAGNEEALGEAASDFVDSYNTLMSSISTSGNASVKGKADLLAGYTTAYKSRLSDIGISVEEDGELKLDMDAFEAADQTEVKKLLNGTSSFAGRVEAKASELSKLASSSSYTAQYNKQGGSEYFQPSGSTLNSKT